ncbi:XK-related protein 6-like [Ptychodera flava]|uniref:XK-related protein 6-like n=1 Tax=Ptychodera flava TaxID=63121 RepID=UPI00396A6052
MAEEGASKDDDRGPKDGSIHGSSQRSDSCSGIKVQPYTIFDFLFTFGSMMTFLADLVTDFLLSVQYLRLDHYWWCGLTFSFIFIPSIIMQIFSLRWYHSDIKEGNGTEGVAKKTSSCGEWFVWALLHIFQLGPLTRYIMTLWYGWKSRSGHPELYYKMVCEYRDVTMLRLLEAFMESAPQLVLQLYIMSRLNEAHWLTVTSACVSLVSLSWSLAAYHKALRESRDDKENINYGGVALQILWRLFTVAARVIALALFASVYLWAVFVIVFVHWLGMTMWLIVQKTDFCPTGAEEIIFDGVIGIVYIFCFFNMKEGKTRYRSTIYYSITFFENVALIGLWYWRREEDYVYTYAAIAFVIGGFFLGMIFMAIYYLCLHPTGNIQCCPSRKRPARTPSFELGTMVDGPPDVVDSAAKGARKTEVFLRPNEVNFFKRDRRMMRWGGRGTDQVNIRQKPGENGKVESNIYTAVPKDEIIDSKYSTETQLPAARV